MFRKKELARKKERKREGGRKKERERERERKGGNFLYTLLFLTL